MASEVSILQFKLPEYLYFSVVRKMKELKLLNYTELFSVRKGLFH